MKTYCKNCKYFILDEESFGPITGGCTKRDISVCDSASCKQYMDENYIKKNMNMRTLVKYLKNEIKSIKEYKRNIYGNGDWDIKHQETIMSYEHVLEFIDNGIIRRIK